MPPPRNQVFESLEEINKTVKEIAKQGQETAYNLNMMRRELGMDGPHGRIPNLEGAIAKMTLEIAAVEARLELRMKASDLDRTEQKKTLDGIAAQGYISEGRRRLGIVLMSVSTSGGMVALLGWLAKLIGLIH